MSLWTIAWRSIQQRALASTLTGISMGLGVALVVAVLVVDGVIGQSFSNNSSLGYNMIVGAKGGKLQLVLNTVYYLSSPIENIPYRVYKEFTHGKYKSYVEKAIPLCLGDYYQQYRVVGTTPEMFSLELSGGRTYGCSSGRIFKPDEFFSGVIGATVARETGLTVGSQFHPTHGAPDGHKHDPITVVGVLEPTGTPNDRALFVNIEGFYLLSNHALPEPVEEPASEEKAGHDHAEHAAEDQDHAAEGHAEHAEQEHDHADEHAEHEHAHEEHAADADHEHAEHAADAQAHDDHDHAAHGDEAHEHAEHGHDDHGHHHHHAPLPENRREVTAILILNSTPHPDMEALRAANAMTLANQVNEGQAAQAVMPIREIHNLFAIFVGPIEMILLALTVLIVVVAGIGVLVSIYNSMSERRREIAIMRALGAGRSTVMRIVLLESILLSLAGGLFGWFLGHAILAGFNPWIYAQTGVNIGFFQSVPLELAIIPGLIVLASLVGYLPAMVAYRTDVTKALVATP